MKRKLSSQPTTTTKTTKTTILPSGDVLVMGAGEAGQLGLGPDIFERLRPKAITYLSDKNIIKLFVGGMHALALSNNGKLYSWGNNDEGTLGRSGEETIPLPIEALDHEFIISAACGDSISAALTTTGKVYQWGTFRANNGVFGCTPTIKNAKLPILVPELKDIIQIDAGANHLIAVSNKGNVFTWGVAEQNQLGRKATGRSLVVSSLTPRSMAFKPKGAKNSKFTCAFAGGYHSFFVHESGTVYSCGLNNHGQLGIGNYDDVDGIVEIEEFNNDNRVTSISGGEHHSVALDEKGHVWVWGRGDAGRLGILDPDDNTKEVEHIMRPTRLQLPALIKQVSAGAAFTVCRSEEESDNVYCFGYGEMGQLGNGDAEMEPTNELVPCKMDLKGRSVYDIGAGGQFTVILANHKL